MNALRKTALCAFLALTVSAAAGHAHAAPPANAVDEVAADAKSLLLRPPPVLPPVYLSYTLPGAVAFRTTKGYYLTAIGGGRRVVAPSVVPATQMAGPWEQSRITVSPTVSYDKSFRTATGN